MPETIDFILGFLPKWEGYATRNNLLYINSKEPTTMTVISIVSALLCNETSQPVKDKRSWILF